MSRKLEIELSDESLDSLLISDLKIQMKGLKSNREPDKKLIKAFKRVIEYYSGNGEWL